MYYYYYYQGLPFRVNQLTNKVSIFLPAAGQWFTIEPVQEKKPKYIIKPGGRLDKIKKHPEFNVFFTDEELIKRYYEEFKNKYTWEEFKEYAGIEER